jgi:type II secretory ATPase GspE/PulE/Tfp pilus assembly ATPase PilB-like protein/nucleotide-binding universal stress UspA family protein
MASLTRILVPTDFSEISTRALAYALDLAAGLKSELHLLHVVTEHMATPPSARDRERLRDIWQKLDLLPRPGQSRDLTVIREVRHGVPAERIVHYAEEHKVGLIVMGTHGRSGLAHLVMGSVAESVLHQAPCPVLAVQPDRQRPQLNEAAAVLREQVGSALAGDLAETRVRMVRMLSQTLHLDDETADRLLADLETAKVITPVVPDEGSSPNDAGPRWLIEPGRLTQPAGHSGDEEGRALDLIRRALEAGATDLHVVPEGESGYAVHFRIDGRLERYCPLHSDLAGPLLRQYRLMANLDIAEPFRPHEGRLRLPPSLAGVEARITALPVAGGEALALRLQLRDRLALPLDRLGLAGAQREAVEKMLRRGAGLVLVTGPTGAGKTTTVYSLLKLLDNGQRHIVSIEDPVEYHVPFIRQSAVDPRHGITMTSGLRTLLRMDPDVIFVGEIRDVEAAEIAMRAASSGRYVFSTLHSRDVAATVTALRDLHVDNRSLAGNLAGIINERLVRRLCPDCRAEAPPDDAQRRLFESEGIEPPPVVGRPVGCPLCRGMGYRNRIGIFEAIVAEGQIAEAIHRGTSEAELRRLFRSAGTPSLLASALTCAREGITSPEEVESILWV